MRKFRVALGFCLALLLPAAVMAQKIEKDYDHKAPWKSYRTYMWIQPAHLEDAAMDPEVVSAINQQLEARGWRQVPVDADVAIVAHGAWEEHQTLESFYSGFPGEWRWHWWAGPPEVTTEVKEYPVGTLVVDMFDARTKQLIWRGYAEATVSKHPEKNAIKLDKAMEKLFDHFPPK
jgi:Domain of unknown function (DUF4136)